jgi:hypothetical protein
VWKTDHSSKRLKLLKNRRGNKKNWLRIFYCPSIRFKAILVLQNNKEIITEVIKIVFDFLIFETRLDFHFFDENENRV